MKCSKCGNELKPGENFCGLCGNSMLLNDPQGGKNDSAANEDAAPTPAKRDNFIDTPKPKKTSTGKIIGIVIAILAVMFLIIVAVIGILLYNFLPGKDADVSDYAKGAGIEGYNCAVNVNIEDIINKEAIREIEQNKINAIVNQLNYTDVGIYVHNLNNGYEYSHNANNAFLSSAMAQVVILDTLSYTVRDNNIDVDRDELWFDYLANGKEAPTSKGEDDTFVTIRKCMEDVAAYGDNNKSNHLVDYIGSVYGEPNGFTVINDTMSDNGYYTTDINRKTYVNPALIDNSASPNVTSPKEIAGIFENLIKYSAFGDETYMKNIFKSVSNDGSAIGLKKFVPAYYDICNANALNSQTTNDVAIISDGDTEIVVAIFLTTYENSVDIEDNEKREEIQKQIVDHILETQFGN